MKFKAMFSLDVMRNPRSGFKRNNVSEFREIEIVRDRDYGTWRLDRLTEILRIEPVEPGIIDPLLMTTELAFGFFAFGFFNGVSPDRRDALTLKIGHFRIR